MADLFDVIADPTRRELLRALLERLDDGDQPDEMSVGELVGQLSLTQPTVSKHLKTLRDHALVTVREQGQHRMYRLDPAGLQPVAEWLGAFVQPVVAEAQETEQPVEPEVVAVAEAAPSHPLPPAARALAVRLGARAAALTGRLAAR